MQKQLNKQITSRFTDDELFLLTELLKSYVSTHQVSFMDIRVHIGGNNLYIESNSFDSDCFYHTDVYDVSLRK